MRSGQAERATVDTTVVVSAFIGQGFPARVIRRWQAGLFVLVVTSDVLAEYADVLSRPRLRDRFGVQLDEIAAFLEDIRGRADLVTPFAMADLPLHVRDPKDDLLLACALGGDCQYLVTGDSDVLALNGHPALGALRVVTPRRFVEKDEAPVSQ
jgi:uncharacterized protein